MIVLSCHHLHFYIILQWLATLQVCVVNCFDYFTQNPDIVILDEKNEDHDMDTDQV